MRWNLVHGDGGTFYRFGETEKITLTADEGLLPDTYEWYIIAYADEWKSERLGDSHKWHFTVSEVAMKVSQSFPSLVLCWI